MKLFEWPDLIDVIVVLAVVLIAGSVVAGLVDMVWPSTYCSIGYVVDKNYTPSSTSVGSGVGSKGSVTTVVMSHSEEWNVIVSLYTGEVVAATAKPTQWAAANKGDKVWVCQRIGKLFGVNWGNRIQ